MIESGSLTPGVSAADFGLPAGSAIRYELPAPALRELMPTYVAMDSDPAVYDHSVGSWMLPSWAQIWVVLTAGPIAVTIGSRRYEELSPVTLYGVTSRAMPVSSNGGVTVCVDLSPLGWARLFAPAAQDLRDRITPLDRLMPAARVAELAAELRATDGGPGVKPVLDAFFERHLPPPHPDEPLIVRVQALLADPTTRDLAAGAAEIGISQQTLLRVSKRHFGFPPKLLLRRARFVRALAGMLVSPGPVDHSAVPPGYHDVPHFIRDANHFLGMTPRRFLSMELLYLRAALRARLLVTAVATPSLDLPDATPLG